VSGTLPVPTDPLRAALERVLGHQYDILRLLGRGGMGAVYLAREKALERAVAIKVLPPEFATAADSRERFRREARVAAKLTHPNIVPLHTFGDVDGMLYFVMGYVKGESLAERLRREGKLPEEDVRRILAEVADALHYAHKQGVVHRDIKPDNVLLDDESGRPMLTDFGVAKAQASGTTLTAAGAVVGTPYYMSPEQASGAQAIDGRSDLYSLGVMGYQMLSGRVPFEGASVQDVLVQHVTREPAPLGALVPDLAPDLAAALMRCLAKEPARRWSDARGLREALQRGADLAEDDESVPGFHAQSLLFVVIAMECAAGMLGVASVVLRGIGAPESWWDMLEALSIATALMTPLLLVPGVAVAERRRQTPWRTLLRVALHPPRWWPFWWPEGWRRPHDVWNRLPPTLRRSRLLNGCSLLLACLGAVSWLLAEGLGNQHWVLGKMLLAAGGASLLTGVFGWLGATWVVGRWGMAKGLTPRDAYRMATLSTLDTTAWSRPRFAALLLPATGRHSVLASGAAEPRSPAEYAQAIHDLVSQLPSGTQATVSEAADAARQLLGTLSLLDAEIGRLAQDADPQELEAVEAKLHALGAESADEGEVRRQKRAALMPQLELLRELNRRLTDASERRGRLLDLLRTMWLQLANLRAEAARDTLAVTEISGRIRALCADIDAHVRAAETVRVVAGG